MKQKIESVLNVLGFGAGDIKCVSDDIIVAYTSPRRSYHDITHISVMINALDDFICNSGDADKIKNIHEFIFAIIMHDYVNGCDNDVWHSIQQAKHFLHKIDNNYNCEYVEHLIRATDYDKHIICDFNQQLIQDLDLVLLGASDAEYDKNSEKIRMEYKMYPDNIFNQRRTEILSNFLSKEYIYNTNFFRDRYEIQARHNLMREISRLK